MKKRAKIVWGIILVFVCLAAFAAKAGWADADGYGSISGVVRDGQGNAIPDACVTAELLNSTEGGKSAVTNAQGQYTLDVLAAGQYRVKVDAEGRVSKYYNNVINENEASTLQVNNEEMIANIDFVMEPISSISGYVRDENGQGLAGISVGWLRTDESGSGYTMTDYTGYYEITELPLGTYIFKAPNGDSDNDFKWATQFYSDRDWYREADLIILESGQTVITGIDFILNTGGSISGVVMDNQGNAIPNAEVRATHPGYGISVNKGTITNAQGEYIINALVTGKYRVRAKAEGCAETFYNNTVDADMATGVMVVKGETTQNINFALAPSGTISGTVKGPDNQGIEGIDVSCVHTNGSGHRSVTTDANGNYIITGLPLRSYLVSASDSVLGNNTGWCPQFYNKKSKNADADPVVLASGQEDITGIDFTLIPGGMISGVVTDKDGEPLDGVSVGCNRIDGMGGQRTITHPDGTYYLHGLEYGTYNIQAAGGWGYNDYTWLSQYYNGKNRSGDADTITISDGSDNAFGKNFVMTPAGWISGTVVDELGKPAANVNVYAEPWNGGSTYQTQTDEAGGYSITQLAAGEYRVRIDQNNMYYNNARNYDEADAVIVTAGQNTSNIDFTFSSQNCFIATAAYGSYLDPHIQVLRDFRDRVLLKSSFGRWFVVQYYQMSPPAAAVIARHEGLRFLVRSMLAPIVFMVAYPRLAGGILLLIPIFCCWKKKPRTLEKAVI